MLSSTVHAVLLPEQDCKLREGTDLALSTRVPRQGCLAQGGSSKSLQLFMEAAEAGGGSAALHPVHHRRPRSGFAGTSFQVQELMIKP